MFFFNFLCAMEYVVKGMMERGNEEAMQRGFSMTTCGDVSSTVHYNKAVTC